MLGRLCEFAQGTAPGAAATSMFELGPVDDWPQPDTPLTKKTPSTAECPIAER
jgi:hypothetical protein